MFRKERIFEFVHFQSHTENFLFQQ